MKVNDKIAYPIIAIGASAGGLPALKKLIGKLPSLFDAAILVMQHLSPDHKDLLPELLRDQRPDLHFVEMRDSDLVKGGSVYLPVPGKIIQVEHGVFKLSEIVDAHLYLPVDTLFISLTKEYQERVIGIILSGTGSDGTRGCAEIREAGGTVFVQDPATAEFSSMPQSVIDTGSYDKFLPPEKIASELIRLLQEQRVPEALEDLTKPEQLSALVELVRRKTGFRFSHYKPSMIARRVERRMHLHGIKNIDEYLANLHHNDTEAEHLARDFMIGVTSFFRDYPQWEMLRESVIPELLSETSAKPVRIWCAGCSTGEEAYSVTMLFMLEMEMRSIQRPLQVFASDVNELALDRARSGIYLENVTVDIPPEYLRRFFICLADSRSLAVIRELREHVVFSKQDILRDLSFSKIDLLICRNLLMYMTPGAQQKCIGIFHYALREDGFLFLGIAEGVDRNSTLFRPVAERKFHCFRRISSANPTRPIPEQTLTDEMLGQDMHRATLSSVRTSLLCQIQTAAIDTLGVGVLAVNTSLEIVYQSLASVHYLTLSENLISHNLLDVLPDAVHSRIRAAVRSVQENGTTVSFDESMTDRNGITRLVAITLSGVHDGVDLYLIIMQEKSVKKGFVPSQQAALSETAAFHGQMYLLERELAATRSTLQNHIEQLRSMNEEMQTANEELKVSNEELQTSEEELRTVNEEILSANDQLRAKIVELEEAQALLRERESHIRRQNDLLQFAPVLVRSLDETIILWNRGMQSLYGFSKGEAIGRVSHKLLNTQFPQPLEEIRRRLFDGGKWEGELHQMKKDGSTVIIQSLWVLHRDEKENPESIIEVNSNITERKLAEEALSQREQRFRMATEAAQFGVFEWNAGTDKPIWENQRMYDIFGLAPDEKPVTFDELVSEFLHPDDRPRIETAMGENMQARSLFNIECRIRRRSDKQWRWVEYYSRFDLSKDDQPVRLFGFVADITGRKQTEETIRRSEERWNLAIEHFADGAIIATEDEQVIYWNPAAREMHGFTRPGEVNEPLERTSVIFQLWTPDGRHMLGLDEWPMKRIKRGEEVRNLEFRLRRPDQGWEKFVSYSGSLVETAHGERLIFLSVHDLTEQRKSEKALRESEAQFKLLADSLPQLVWMLRSDGITEYVNQRWYDYTGAGVRETSGEKWAQLIHPGDMQRTIDLWKHCVQTGEPYTIEYRLRRKSDSSYRWFLTRALPVRDEHGRIIHWFGTATDIHEQKQLLEDLRESEASLKRAQEIAHLGSWELDLATNRLTWSDEIYRIFGLQPHEFDATYEAFLDHVHPHDRAAVDVAYSGSVLEGRDSYEIEHRVVRRSTGEIRYVHEKCQHVHNARGKIVRSIGMVHDITERKLAEEQIRLKTEALENANRDLARFNHIAVGREMRMIELKREINALCVKLGEPPRYSLDFADEEK